MQFWKGVNTSRSNESRDVLLDSMRESRESLLANPIVFSRQCESQVVEKKKQYFLAKKVKNNNQSNVDTADKINFFGEDTLVKKNNALNSIFGLETEASAQGCDINENERRLSNQCSNHNTRRSIKLKNIFEESLVSAGKVRGPKYDDQGGILERTLVGKAEWFSKKDQQWIEDKHMQGESRDSQRGNKEQTKQSSMSSFSVKKSLVAGRHASVRMKKVASNMLTKGQLLEMVPAIRERIEKSKVEDLKKMEALKFEEKLQASKNERMLKMHNEKEKNWEKFILNSAEELNRDLGYSMLVDWAQKRKRGGIMWVWC